ncbi:hypothetical protein [Aureimonas sp. N4]|uniref:hypothetical protein n=1 Tax=Aureimonas sp. N4 TaxID=1638165 RepID=UPI0012E3BDA1|nr:hypothetical protein [Aureimonas sp. N4]
MAGDDELHSGEAKDAAFVRGQDGPYGDGLMNELDVGDAFLVFNGAEAGGDVA